MKKLTALLLAGLLLISCNSETTVDPVTGETITKPDRITESDDTAAETEEIVTRTTHLTGIFEKELLPRVGDNYYARDYPVTFDENGNFRIFGKTGEGDARTYGLLTVNPDGEVLEKIEVTYDTGYNIELMTAFGGSVYYTQNIMGTDVYLYARGENEQDHPVKMQKYFSPEPDYGQIQHTGLCTDGNGNVYICCETEVAVFAPDLTPLFYLSPKGGISAMDTDTDGTVYIASGEGDSYGLYPIDVEKKALGTPHLLGDLRIENLYFGDGYDFYYTDYETAVFGVNYPAEEGHQPRVTEVMNYNNSGVSNTTFTLIGVVDAETIIAAAVAHFSNERAVPTLYKKAPDRPLEGITVIEVAYTDASQYFEADVMEFNRTHDDIMVVLQNYARFSNEIEPDAGETRLAMDVVTGVYVPDIILGTYDEPVVKTMVDRGAFVDLTSYISSDPVVSKDNIIDSILYSYSTDDGKLWGLPTKFQVNTLAANNAVTGGITQWTLTELLDLIDSLPAGSTVMGGLSRENVIQNLLGNNAYAAFIDLEAGTCSFDTGDFARLLEFIKSLPKTIHYDVRTEEAIELRNSGRQALYLKSFRDPPDWFSLEAIFNTKDISLPGFPSNGKENGAQLEYLSSYTILSSSANPDAAWEFVRFMLSDDYVFSHDRGTFTFGYPILRDRCRELLKKTLNTIYDFHFTLGSSSAFTAFTEEARAEHLASEMREPGVRVIPTEEMIDDFMSYLANDVGQRIVNRIPDEINDIVNEEIETYLTGVKDAKACAGVIQSRVNIWLAEHQ